MEEEVGGGVVWQRTNSISAKWMETDKVWREQAVVRRGEGGQGADTCYRAAINPRDGTLCPQTLHRRGHCRHHSGLLASPRPSSEHLPLPCPPHPPDPAPLQLALIKSDIIHLHLPLILQAASTRLKDLNFIQGCMFRWEVTDNKALMYGDIYRCTLSPFIPFFHSLLCCLTTDDYTASMIALKAYT